ncbi:hypothetical protein HY572_04930 [Candidatus Micrarchaeota archaeon]|nr:hypothetical protein [Candidatus Micrarchaeota archaeon]
MDLQYGALARSALNYARHSQAVWAYLGFAVAAVLSLLTLGALAYALGALNPATILSSASSLGLLIFFGFVWLAFLVLGGLAVYGAVIQNAVHGGTLTQSLNDFKPRFWSLVGAALFVTAVNVLLAIPLNLGGLAVPALEGLFGALGLLVSLALGLTFLFVDFYVVLSDVSAWAAIKKSVHVFLREPIDVLLVMLVSTLLAVGVMLAGLLGLLVLAILALAVVGFNASALGLLLVPSILAAVFIALLVVFAAEIVQLHFVAHAFLALEKPQAAATPQTRSVSVAPAKKPKKPVRKSGKAKPKVKKR